MSVGESAQAQFAASASQSRLSVAVTSILTDGNAAATNSFAAEQILPSADYAYSSPAAITVEYTTQAINAGTTVAITGVTMSAGAAVNASTQLTVERATASAISSAAGASQFGDVSGIVRAWTEGTSVLD